MSVVTHDSLAVTPVSVLKGVGPKLNQLLQQLHIFTVQDLLFHLPARYEDRTRITSMADLVASSKILVEGEIVTGQIQFGKKRSLVCRLQDGTGAIQLRFFHFNAEQSKQLTKAGLNLRCFGEVRQGFRGQFEMVHPQYQIVTKEQELEVEQSLSPIYSTCSGINQATWRKLIDQTLTLLQTASVEEYLPAALDAPQSEMTLVSALKTMHRPSPQEDVDLLQSGNHPAQQRLAFEELVAQQIGLNQFRAQSRQKVAPKLSGKYDLQQSLIKKLAFKLTQAQQKVIQEINTDLDKNYPMLRLVQGDVGSGKTIVAALALVQAVEHQMQAVMMAPTELLAEQHFHSLSQWLTPMGIKVGWLSGGQKESERRRVIAEIAAQELMVIVGTHALFQEGVEFANLALVVIDEQHRFGVHQRLSLKNKGSAQGYCPHQVVMTATPIPRTLAMSVYSDLDLSVINELPPGRKPIQTLLIPNERREEIITRVQANCREGRQAYWVCTIIEDSETLRAEAAAATLQTLKQFLPDLNVGLIHGRLKQEEKESIMHQFKQGEIDLLVATTVIEVGVDVPNASLMIIENAERLGLAQLHQLRGRVGRGEIASFCVMLYQSPLSQNAKKRLQVMRQSQNGFDIAEEDLKIRGPGELLGTKQTGVLKLKVADLVRDGHLLPEVNRVCRQLLEHHPEYVTCLVARWLGGKQQYAEV